MAINKFIKCKNYKNNCVNVERVRERKRVDIMKIKYDIHCYCIEIEGVCE